LTASPLVQTKWPSLPPNASLSVRPIKKVSGPEKKVRPITFQIRSCSALLVTLARCPPYDRASASACAKGIRSVR
jgi:hypothetical protein